MTPEPPPVLTRPPPDLAGWAGLFDAAALPVLAETAAEIEEWRANEDAVDAHLLAESIAQDPLMTLKLYANLAQTRKSRPALRDHDARSDVETVTAALVMLGIGPFFRAFGPQPVAEDWLKAEARALDGFRGVLQRARRAAAFSIGFAVHRMDHDAGVLHEAALLHDFAELLLWLRAWPMALSIQQRQRDDPQLRTAQIQRELLNVELPALQHRLMVSWQLPALLVRCTDDRHVEDIQVRNVLLAIRVARHSAEGWDNPALPDDVRDIAELLHLGEAPTLRLLRDIDADL